MSTSPRPVSEKPSDGITSITVVLARVMWTLLGPAALGLATIGIVRRGTGWFTSLDAFYGIVVALMLGCRWVEQQSGTATTVTGAPATIHHFRRYVVVLLLVAAVVWVGANAIGNHVLK